MANPTLGTNFTRSIAQTSQYVQELWTREVEQPWDKILQAAKLVRDRSGLAKDGGDILRVPFVAAVDARAKAASTGVTYDSPEGAPIAINIDKHYYVAVLIEDIAKVQSNYEMAKEFRTRMSEALARQIDTDLMALYSVAGTSVSGGAAIDDADMLSVVAAFDAANVPMEHRRGIIGHNTKIDLLGVNKYVAYDQTGKKGEAVSGSTDYNGTIYGMDLYHSGNVPVSTTGRNLFFHKDAISLIQQMKPKFEMEYSVDALGTKTVLHTIYGLGAERTAGIVELTRTTAA